MTVESNVNATNQIMGILNDVYPYAQCKWEVACLPSWTMKNFEHELYPSCEDFKVVMTIMDLMHCKMKFHMSNQHYDYFMGVFQKDISKEICLPKDHKSE